MAVVTILAVGLILTTFRPVCLFGVTILTSAGVIGAVLGLSARTALGNAFAGIQVAFADGLHVGDVLVVDGEWGRVEEVKLTNVVIRLWDERILILPTTYFTERPFQNWTRDQSRVIGKIQIHVDHTADLNEMRREARRLIEASPLWDRDRWVLQMVDATPQTVVIQVQASAADGASAWDLRCDLREGLISYLRDQHPNGCRALAASTSPDRRPGSAPASSAARWQTSRTSRRARRPQTPPCHVLHLAIVHTFDKVAPRMARGFAPL